MDKGLKIYTWSIRREVFSVFVYILISFFWGYELIEDYDSDALMANFFLMILLFLPMILLAGDFLGVSGEKLRRYIIPFSVLLPSLLISLNYLQIPYIVSRDRPSLVFIGYVILTALLIIFLAIDYISVLHQQRDNKNIIRPQMKITKLAKRVFLSGIGIIFAVAISMAVSGISSIFSPFYISPPVVFASIGISLWAFLKSRSVQDTNEKIYAKKLLRYSLILLVLLIASYGFIFLTMASTGIIL